MEPLLKRRRLIHEDFDSLIDEPTLDERHAIHREEVYDIPQDDSEDTWEAEPWEEELMHEEPEDFIEKQLDSDDIGPPDGAEEWGPVRPCTVKIRFESTRRAKKLLTDVARNR